MHVTYRRGLVLGKFMPPHAGHQHLVEVAASLCERLCIVVGTQPSEELPGQLRHEWMCQLYPEHEVVHLHQEMPQLPEQHPDFWRLWREALGEVAGTVNLVVAGEDYGQRLAQELGADFVLVPRSEGLELSATAVRQSPSLCWPRLPGVVRRWYCTRVRVVGPESSGKTTLSRHLAARFGGTWVAEFARAYLEQRGGEVHLADMPLIARGQAASEDALAENSGGLLVADTDPTLTTIWSEALFDSCAEVVRNVGHGRRYDLTLLVAPSEEWIPDPVRYQADLAERVKFFQRCQELYPEAIVLEGSWQARTERAEQALLEIYPPARAIESQT